MTVVTINYNDYKTVIKFINEIKLYNNIDHIIIVDNCSTDNSYQYLLEFVSDKVEVIQSEKMAGMGMEIILVSNMLKINLMKNMY